MTTASVTKQANIPPMLQSQSPSHVIHTIQSLCLFWSDVNFIVISCNPTCMGCFHN